MDVSDLVSWICSVNDGKCEVSTTGSLVRDRILGRVGEAGFAFVGSFQGCFY